METTMRMIEILAYGVAYGFAFTLSYMLAYAILEAADDNQA